MHLHDSQLWLRGSSSSLRFFVTAEELSSALAGVLRVVDPGWVIVPSQENRLCVDESRPLPAGMQGLRASFVESPCRLLVMRESLLKDALATDDPLATASLSGAVFVDYGPLRKGDTTASRVDPSVVAVVNKAKDKVTGQVERNEHGPRLFLALKTALKPILVQEIAIRLKSGEIVLERGLKASFSAAEILRDSANQTYWRLAS